MVANLRHHAADRLGVRCLICGDANGKRVAVTRGAALGSDTVRDAHGCHRQVETNLILRSEDIDVADTSAPCYAASEHRDARLRRLSARQANRRRKFACRICHPQDTTRSRSLRECRSKCSSRSIAARWHSTRSIHCSTGRQRVPRGLTRSGMWSSGSLRKAGGRSAAPPRCGYAHDTSA
jgi:hypothetical protein